MMFLSLQLEPLTALVLFQCSDKGAEDEGIVIEAEGIVIEAIVIVS
jgi:hypothetical protein